MRTCCKPKTFYTSRPVQGYISQIGILILIVMGVGGGRYYCVCHNIQSCIYTNWWKVDMIYLIPITTHVDFLVGYSLIIFLGSLSQCIIKWLSHNFIATQLSGSILQTQLIVSRQIHSAHIYKIFPWVGSLICLFFTKSLGSV